MVLWGIKKLKKKTKKGTKYDLEPFWFNKEPFIALQVSTCSSSSKSHLEPFLIPYFILEPFLILWGTLEGSPDRKILEPLFLRVYS